MLSFELKCVSIWVCECVCKINIQEISNNSYFIIFWKIDCKFCKVIFPYFQRCSCWFFSWALQIWRTKLIEFLVLSHSWIPGINSTWLWCMSKATLFSVKTFYFGFVCQYSYLKLLYNFSKQFFKILESMLYLLNKINLKISHLSLE